MTLTQHLIKFISELMSKKQKEYIYYIPLFPTDQLVGEVGSVILSADMIDEFDWKGIRQFLSEDLYVDLVYKTIEKYQLRSRNGIKAAKKIVALMGDYERGLQFLFGMVVEHYLNLHKYGKEEIAEAVELGSTWCQDETVSKIYPRLF